VERLAPIYANLARALTETGISGSQLNEILTTRLKARCVKCDIQLASDEIEQVSLVEDPTQLSHPKLKRLRLGYCAREGCESDDYQIQLESCPGVDWDIIAAKANDLMSAQKAAEQEAVRRQERQKQIQRTKRAILALLTGAACLLLLFVWRQGRLPFVKKPHKYQIDPASVNPGPRR
jgi:hypothetical protein